MAQPPPTQEDFTDFKDDLSRYYGVWDADHFAGQVLGRPVSTEHLTHDELQQVREAARRSYEPYERAWADVQAANVAALSPAQATLVGADWLR